MPAYNFRGQWRPNTQYKTNDVVTSDYNTHMTGNMYAATTDGISGKTFTQDTFWSVWTPNPDPVPPTADSDATAITTEAATARAAESVNATAIATKAQALIPTPTKTTAYTAVAGDFVPVDTTNGVVPITLPSAPVDRARIAVKLTVLGGSNTVTISCSGSDKFNTPTGSTTATLSLLNQAIQFQYQVANAVWMVTANDLPLGQLDTRFAPASEPVAITNLATATGRAAALALIFGS